MAKNLTIKNFSNFGSPTVQSPEKLVAALAELSKNIAMPHFKTKRGKEFAYEEIDQALKYKDPNGAKAILKSR